MPLGSLTRLGTEEERPSHCSWGIAKGMPHRLGDFGEGVLMNLVTNRLELFCPEVPRKPGDLLLIILEVEVLIPPSNIASRAGGCPFTAGGLAGGSHCT